MVSNHQQRQGIGYAFGYQPVGPQVGNPLFDMNIAFPMMSKYYGLLAGIGFTLSYSISGIFSG